MKTVAPLLACAALAAALPAFADTPATWNGAAAPWSTAADWSTSPTVPLNNSPAGALYDVTISGGPVSLNVNPTIQQLTLSNATLTAGSLTVNGGITLGGQLDYLGTSTGTATLTNAANSLATLGNTAPTYLEFTNASSFNNAGTFSAVNGGLFNAGTGGSFNNTGTFALNLPKIGSFFNTGNGLAFNNSGIAVLNTGTLVLGGDSGNTTGSFSITSTAALNLNGNFTFAPSSTIAGAGYLNFVTGTFTFKGASPISVPNLNFAGGTVTAPSSLNFTSNITWSGGTFAHAPITLAGNTTIAGMEAVDISAATVTLAANTTNTLGASGNVSLYLQNSSSFNNAGTLTLSNGSLLTTVGGGVFNNSGSLLVNLPAASTFSVGNSVLFNNSGTVSITAGTLALSGDTNNTAGSFSISANATLRFSANMSLTSAASISGAGALDIASGTTTLHAGLPALASLSIESTLINAANGSNAGTSKLASLSLSNTGVFNLGQNKLILEPSPAAKPSALATLQSEVNAGKTSSFGIRASSLPANESLAVADNAALAHPLSSLGGIPVSSADILITPALLGDTNLDGHVDLNDLNTLLNHLGTTTPSWTNGNFDGAATIDLNDLNDILNNLGTSYLNNASATYAQSILAPTPTPEPATLLLLAPLALAAARRQRPTPNA